MGILVKDRNGIYDDTAIPQAYDPALGAYRDAASALVRDGEIWREVWPDKTYLIRDGIVDDRLGNFDSSVYFNTHSNTGQPRNNASFSAGSDGYTTFSCVGISHIESNGYLVSYGAVTGKNTLVIECGGDYSDISGNIEIGVITDADYQNLIKNTKRAYTDGIDYPFASKSFGFGALAKEPPSVLKRYELDVSEAAGENLHLFVHAYASGSETYYCNVRIKNMVLI